MRTTLLTLALVMAGGLAWGQAASINWMSLEEAVAAQQKEPRKIVMDVYTKWCGPCKMMMANTFTNASVIEYINSNYYAVKFDAESPDPVTFQGNEFKNPTYDPNRRGRNGVIASHCRIRSGGGFVAIAPSCLPTGVARQCLWPILQRAHRTGPFS